MLSRKLPKQFFKKTMRVGNAVSIYNLLTFCTFRPFKTILSIVERIFFIQVKTSLATSCTVFYWVVNMIELSRSDM